MWSNTIMIGITEAFTLFPSQESTSNTSSSSSERSQGSLGSLGDLVDVDALSDSPANVVLLSEDDIEMNWTE